MHQPCYIVTRHLESLYLPRNSFNHDNILKLELNTGYTPCHIRRISYDLFPSIFFLCVNSQNWMCLFGFFKNSHLPLNFTVLNHLKLLYISNILLYCSNNKKSSANDFEKIIYWSQMIWKLNVYFSEKWKKNSAADGVFTDVSFEIRVVTFNSEKSQKEIRSSS